MESNDAPKNDLENNETVKSCATEDEISGLSKYERVTDISLKKSEIKADSEDDTDGFFNEKDQSEKVADVMSDNQAEKLEIKPTVDTSQNELSDKEFEEFLNKHKRLIDAKKYPKTNKSKLVEDFAEKLAENDRNFRPKLTYNTEKAHDVGINRAIDAILEKQRLKNKIKEEYVKKIGLKENVYQRAKVISTNVLMREKSRAFKRTYDNEIEELCHRHAFASQINKLSYSQGNFNEFLTNEEVEEKFRVENYLTSHDLAHKNYHDIIEASNRSQSSYKTFTGSSLSQRSLKNSLINAGSMKYRNDYSIINPYKRTSYFSFLNEKRNLVGKM